MPVTSLDERTALVLIDFQQGILGLPLVHPADRLLKNATRLERGFRDAKLPIIFVHVNDLRESRADEQAPALALPPGFDEFSERLRPEGDDIVVTKHGWDAFYATDLDLQLRRRSVTGIVLAGIAASRGVESTARSAHVRGYNLAFASDAISDIDQPSFDYSLKTIFPRIGEVDVTASVVRHLIGRIRHSPEEKEPSATPHRTLATFRRKIHFSSKPSLRLTSSRQTQN